MSHSRPNTGIFRRWVAIASAAIALLALAAQPALAAGGYQRAGRPFEVLGAVRSHLRIDARMADPSPASGVSLEARFGSGGSSSSIGLMFHADGTTVASRLLKLDGYGIYKGVTGTGCTFTPYGGGAGRLQCQRSGYDWKTDRYYRMSLVRGNHTTDGWLWTVKATELTPPPGPGKPDPADVTTTVVSFRTPAGNLSTGESGAALAYSNIGNCEAIDRLAGIVKLPYSSTPDGPATVVWGAAELYRSEGSCSNSTLRATLNTAKTLSLVVGP